MAVLLCVGSAAAYAHSHSPTRFEKNSPWNYEKLVLEVKNLNAEPLAFEIEINGKIVGSTPAFKSFQQEKIRINLRLEEGINKFDVCTITKPDNPSLVRTRICTKVTINKVGPKQ